jgi:hypothetical protein
VIVGDDNRWTEAANHGRVGSWNTERIANAVYPVDTVTLEMDVLQDRTSIEFAARILVEPKEKRGKRRRRRTSLAIPARCVQ